HAHRTPKRAHRTPKHAHRTPKRAHRTPKHAHRTPKLLATHHSAGACPHQNLRLARARDRAHLRRHQPTGVVGRGPSPRLEQERQMSKQRIGVLGTGNVGQVLAAGLVARGHEVKLGSRDATNPKAVAWAEKNGALASAGTFADAAKFGEIVILALSWTGVMNALELAGPDNFAGKVVIDAVNPL